VIFNVYLNQTTRGPVTPAVYPEYPTEVPGTPYPLTPKAPGVYPLTPKAGTPTAPIEGPPNPAP
jgi:hypothetical protein